MFREPLALQGYVREFMQSVGSNCGVMMLFAVISFSWASTSFVASTGIMHLLYCTGVHYYIAFTENANYFIK